MKIGEIVIIVFVTFIVLKLCGVVTWPWLWVCVPIFILAGIIAMTFLMALAVALLIGNR